jgi:hypothetical protein
MEMYGSRFPNDDQQKNIPNISPCQAGPVIPHKVLSACLYGEKNCRLENVRLPVEEIGIMKEFQ